MKYAWISLVLCFFMEGVMAREFHGDCRDIAQWDAKGDYPRVADTEFVVYENRLWGHKDATFEIPGHPPAWSTNTPAWTLKDTCLLQGTAFIFDTLQAIQSSSSTSTIRTQVTWKADSRSSLRCDLSGQLQDSANRKCINPEEISGAYIQIPRNVTRISKDMFTLCKVDRSKTQPSVIVYIMDYSGSMLTSDPKAIAPLAVSAAIQTQFELDSNSYAGFYAFSDRKKMAYEPVRLGLGVNKTALISKIYPEYSGGTLYLPPIVQTMASLNQDKFNGYTKAIVFVSDGRPTDLYNLDSIKSLISKSSKGLVLLHGIFLNRDSAGSGVLKSMTEFTKDSLGNKGSFAWIQNSSDMSALIQTIVQKTVIRKSPIGMRVLHQGTGQAIVADSSQIMAQADGAIRVGLNTNLLLSPGENKLAFQTLYLNDRGEETSTNIFFTVAVQNQVYNHELAIAGTPFGTSCYEPNQLRILVDRDSSAVEILKKDQGIQIRLVVEDPKGYGDSVLVRLKTKGGDTLILSLPLLKGSQPLTYSRSLPIYWDKVDSKDQKLQLNAKDSIFAFWQHPTDPQDASEALKTVFWPWAQIQKAELWDRNHDGILDEVLFRSDLGMEEWMLARYKFLGQFVQGENAQEKDIDWAKMGKWSINADSQLTWKANSPIFALYTGLPKSKWSIRTQKDDGSVVETDLRLVDQMQPMLTRARIVYKGVQALNAELVLKMSEAVLSDSLTKHPAFNFRLGGHLEKNAMYQEGHWSNAWEYRIPFEVENSIFAPKPGDSAQLKVGTGYVMDSAFLWTHDSSRMVLIDGELPLKLELKSLGKLDEETQVDSNFAVRVLTEGQDPKSWLKEQNQIALVIGPLKKTREDVDPELAWKVEIYDQQGQFLTQANGMLQCDLPTNRSACLSSGGLYQGLVWNHRDEKGRKAGVGAYLLRFFYGKEEKIFKVGLTRFSVPD